MDSFIAYHRAGVARKWKTKRNDRMKFNELYSSIIMTAVASLHWDFIACLCIFMQHSFRIFPPIEIIPKSTAVAV